MVMLQIGMNLRDAWQCVSTNTVLHCGRLTLEQAHEHCCSVEGYHQLLQTAERFQIAPETLLGREQLDRLFRDDGLSRKALSTHAARNA